MIHLVMRIIFFNQCVFMNILADDWAHTRTRMESRRERDVVYLVLAAEIRERLAAQ